MLSIEMQAMATMLSSLPQFQGDEEDSASDRPRSSPFVEACVHDTFMRSSMRYSPAVFVPPQLQPE